MALKFRKDPDFAVHNRLANNTAARDLSIMVAQIEAMASAKGDAARDEADCYVVAKSKGYDVKALKRLVRERRMDADKLREEMATLDLYKQLIGMA